MGVRYRLLRAMGAVAAALCVVPVAACSSGPTPAAHVVQVPATYKSYFTVAARRCPSVLTPQRLAATAYVESRFEPDAESANGAQGLMQILPSVFREYGIDADGDGRKDVFAPADAVATGASYLCTLSRLVESMRGDLKGSDQDLIFAAYNAGIGNVRRYHGVPPFQETRDYIDQVRLWTDRFTVQFRPKPSPAP
jgi:soluble lytic murein transglycosylase-like protein